MSSGNGQPPRKKQRQMESTPLALQHLAAHTVSFPEVLSPGALHSCRIAAAAPLDLQTAVSYELYAASGRRVYCLCAPRPPSGTAFAGERGKEGVYIPAHGKPLAAGPLEGLPHRAEVQELRLAEDPATPGAAVLASVDCYGRAVLAHMRRGYGDGGGGGGVEAENAEGGDPAYQLAGLHQVQPPDLLREAGWAGVAVLPDTPTQVAVARHFAKDVTLFDGPLVTRTLHTLYNPNAIELLGSDLAPLPGGGPLVAVAEGPQVSLWDVRASGRGARVARLGPGPHHGALYALAASAGGGQPLLGAAGADRGVLVYDPRKWSLLHRWASCLKYEATALHFFTASPQHAVVAGLDYEVLCAEWSSGRASRLPATSHFGSGAGPGGAAATQQRRQQHMQQQQRRQQGRAVGPQLQPEGGDDDEEGIFANAARGITFRGDAHWLGLAKVAGQDVFAGLTSSGQLYIAEFA